MAAVITKETWLGSRIYLKQEVHVQGTGAPATGDGITSDTKKYPIGTLYIDKIGQIGYLRCATAAVTSDWKALNV